MFAGYYLIAGVLPRLPLIAALIVGVVLIGRHRSRLGRRRAALAQFGVGTIFVGMVLAGLYTALIPQIWRTIDYSSETLAFANVAVSIVMDLLNGAGVVLLILAAVSRAPSTGPVDGFTAGAAYAPVPLAPVPLAPVPLAPVPLAPVQFAPGSESPAPDLSSAEDARPTAEPSLRRPPPSQDGSGFHSAV
jgi:hypothetical protein